MTTAWEVAGDPELFAEVWRLGPRGRESWVASESLTAGASYSLESSSTAMVCSSRGRGTSTRTCRSSGVDTGRCVRYYDVMTTQTAAQRTTLETIEVQVGNRTAAVGGWSSSPVWTERSIARGHCHLIATSCNSPRGAIWTADEPQPSVISHELPDRRDYPHTPKHGYRVDVRCPKFIREAFDAFIDDMKEGQA